MTFPNPALVTKNAAQSLPRGALFLLCAVYVLPGLFGRDPWKNADITAFGYMMNMAQGHSTWVAPSIGGLPGDMALLPYWFGAASIKFLHFGWGLDAALAARIPFALLLVLVLALTWYGAYHLARTNAAQPLPFAFGGEAEPTAYARAMADGALLALVATLGLLQLGHETTPELAQLASLALYVYALAASPFRVGKSKIAILLALPALAASGAPSIAVALAVVGAVTCKASSYAPARRFVIWIVCSCALSVAVSATLGVWAWRVSGWQPADILETVQLLAWFTWPAWPLAFWTIWRWRHHLMDRHIAVPLGCAVVGLLACVAMGGSQRALLLATPPLAVLAAFALPTLQRSTAAALDWFSVCFFTIFAAAIWVVYASMQTGVPAQPAINIARLAPGYTPYFSTVVLALALAASAAWLWLVRWRTGRSRHPLWKSLVLPASGVALCWLLAMTLLLPPLNHARSYQSLMQRIAKKIPQSDCVSAPDMPLAQVAALEQMGGFKVDAVTPTYAARCNFLLLMNNRATAATPTSAGPEWKLIARERRNKGEDEITLIYQRQPLRPRS
jgi:hypothetical protein